MHIQDKGFRTVLTYGENIVYLYGFIYFYIPFTLDVIRLFSGPLAQNLCWFTIFSKNFAAIGAQFGFVICIIIRVSSLTFHFRFIFYLLIISVPIHCCVQISGHLPRWPFRTFPTFALFPFLLLCHIPQNGRAWKNGPELLHLHRRRSSPLWLLRWKIPSISCHFIVHFGDLYWCEF